MGFKKFNEYLDEKGKLVEKPKDKEKYKSKIKKDKESLSSMGNKDLVYEPKTEPLQNKAPEWHKEKGDAALPKPQKLPEVGPTSSVSKVKEWLDKTRGMSISEFAKNIHEEKNVEIDTSKIKNVQDLLAAAIEVVKNNPSLVENITREIKRASLCEAVVSELLKDKSILESVGLPVGFEKLSDDESEENEDQVDDDGEEELRSTEDSDDEEYEDSDEDEDSDSDDEEYEDSDDEDEDSDDEEEKSPEEDYGGDEEEDDEDEDYFGKFGKYNR